jgi:hypothetical protein
MTNRLLFAIFAVGFVPTLAHATETTIYSYDAKGRLIKVVRVGSGTTPVNLNVRVDYAHDKANNRKTVIITR